METNKISEKEVKAITKVYLSVAIGLEHWSLQDDEVYETLVKLLIRMGFERNYDFHSLHDLVYHTESVDQMIKNVKNYSYKEIGDLLFNVVELRNKTDGMGGQFSDSFDLFLIYLLNRVLGKRSGNHIIIDIGNKYF